MADGISRGGTSAAAVAMFGHSHLPPLKRAVTLTLIIRKTTEKLYHRLCPQDSRMRKKCRKMPMFREKIGSRIGV
jgi:hypothetical protein